MLNLNYIGDSKNYPVSFRNINQNIVEVIGDIPKKKTGFIITRIGDPFAFKGDYSDFKTVYREVEGGFQYSNDGSVYVEPLPKVNFYTSGGGVLEGELQQEAETYEDLIIPEPIANENYVFTQWMPEIPESGAIDGNKSFNAIFTSTIPEPEPEPAASIEDRVSSLEEDVQKLNNALGGAE